MTSKRKKAWAAILVLAGSSACVLAHCQIPCGIYGDKTRFDLLREHITTIEKSMTEIARLGTEKTRNDNQLVRWVVNKENHAAEFAEIITFYFMAQRLKPVPKADTAAYTKYVEQIGLLHQLLVLAMKTKQSTDTALCAELRSALHQFEHSYGAH